MSVGDDLLDRGVCWKKSGIVSAFGKRGVLNLMDTRESSTSVGDIWSRLQSGGTYHGAGSGYAAAGRNY